MVKVRCCRWLWLATAAGPLTFKSPSMPAFAQGKPAFLHGYVEDSPLLATPGETFQLRKLLPQVTNDVGEIYHQGRDQERI